MDYMTAILGGDLKKLFVYGTAGRLEEKWERATRVPVAQGSLWSETGKPLLAQEDQQSSGRGVLLAAEPSR